ncbi:MAG: TlpA family protein disulfide reductase [Nitrososphaeria archaeon]|nr:TlpA family protein disulfide reductase [Nitrososphaeria archaeon]MDW8043523.1 TlpA disulfide reductase family protein [Nitrososphaerota archaeon]
MGKRKGKKRPESRARELVIAFVPAALLVGLLVYLVSQPVSPTLITPQRTAHQGETAPDFTARVLTPDGLTERSFSLSEYRGSVIFLDFVFSWCPHCKNMAPKVKALHEEFSAKGVRFVTVAGSSRSSPEDSAKFLRDHGISWTAVYDAEMSVFQKFGVRGTPTYVVIGRDGRIITKLAGEQPYEVLKGYLQEALGG